MSALRREAIGPFQASEAMPIDELSIEPIQRKLLPAALAVSDMPRIVVNDAELSRLAQGQSIGNRFGVSASEIAALDSTDTLAAILVLANGDLLRPTKCFPSAASAK